ncbi:PGP1, putative [Trichomonas vaginalis G3]|uniref:PGP1, putative n=1 Tax=Trichomonas vaginalis (strain ATCC PRA-98 / G3) TaxID=412133 RepID=A2DGJ3_TRIV3|nr:ATPase activity, coupled to transmembrane movement of substances [Trichomonas vaginalis G3]EAY20380.1 PGP1, putative [Trichomonas vaginalis G3]KAI5490572.1 ATPase activity, coupled to transmembrane movement of substances [Trichomonas vaginalis G3]|eukprot:XP_001581366.1 PGP1 [Trichomonas vaginalis G3]
MPVVICLILGGMATAMTTSDDFMGKVTNLIYSFIIYAVCYILCFCIFSTLTAYAGPYFISDIRKHFFRKLMELDISFYEKNESGVLLGRFTNDCTTMHDVYISQFLISIQCLAQAVAGVILSFIISWRVTLAVFIAYPLCGIVFVYSQKKLGAIFGLLGQSESNSMQKAEEVITSFRTVKSFDNELYECDQYKEALDSINNCTHKGSNIQFANEFVNHIILQGMVIGFMYFSSWIIINRPNWGLENGDLMVLILSLFFASLAASISLGLRGGFVFLKY